MSKQHIPSDTELLNAMQAAKTKGYHWVCRASGYGLALHETSPRAAEACGWDAYPTVREAIAATMKKENER